MGVKISDIATVKGGKRLPKGQELLTTETIHPYIRAQNIRDGRINLDEPRYLTPEQHRRLRRYIVQTNDVCIVIVGANVGDVGIVPVSLDGANLTENAVKLTDFKSGYVPAYVNYCLASQACQAQMRQVAGGAAQPKLGIYKVLDIEIPPLSVDEQHRVVATLSPYDDLIENNTRRIKILEQIAQTIYQEWFAEFRFPGHEKIETKDSSLGTIPASWQVAKLGDVLRLEYGKALKADERLMGNVPVFGSSGIVGYHSEKLTSGPGIIVGRKGNVGSVFFSETDFWVIDTAYFVSTRMPLHYVYFNLLTQNFLNNDAAVPGLNRNQAHSLPMLVPDLDTLRAFEGIVEPIFRLRACLENRNSLLQQSRDLLLPRLVSGEISMHPVGTEAVAQGA